MQFLVYFRHMDTARFQSEFLNRVDEARGLALLFDNLPEIYLFVKNRKSQFTKVNRSLLHMLGLTDESEMLGKTDMDFYPPEIARKYIEEDQQVMKQQKGYTNRIWLVPGPDGLLVWYLCSKIPLYSRSGKVIGIAGTLRDYKTAGAVLEPYHEMADIIEYITRKYAAKIEIHHLAEMACLSVSQFERRFKKLFQLTPLQYILKVRMHMACHSLVQSNASITQIAQNCGFYDHSYFTRKFVKMFGLTPKNYRSTQTAPESP